QKYPFDFVIGSVHVVDRMDPYEGVLFQGKSDEEIYERTFEQTVENIKAVKDFDVLGHIDYIIRYGKHKAQGYSYEKYAPYLDAILKTVIECGKGIELNTSGFKYGLGFCHPHPDIIKRYKELGGEIITIGADGHRPEHIAYDFDKVSDILKDCGFKYYTEFQQRIPKFKQLP
ncbi:MAG: PHP domain-containing protein, partial [Lachnospiraceae bacterium]